MKGFTLIETLVYLALLGVLMTGAVTALYSIEDSVDAERSAVTVENEGDFVLQKFAWYVQNGGNDTSAFVLSSGHIYLNDGGPALLTSDNVAATDLSVSVVKSATGSSIGMTMAFTLDGTSFHSTEYYPS